MAKDIEILEQIKKQEDSSDKKIRDAQTRAEKMLADARRDAQKRIDNAVDEAQKSYNATIQKAKKDAERKRFEMLALAKKRAEGIKLADKSTILKIFQKVVKDRFGV